MERTDEQSGLDAHRRSLLTKRTMTVQQLQLEMRAGRSQKPAAGESPRPVPVPLLAGETLHEYTRKFHQWLADRGHSVDALRADPSRERNFLFSFAYLRAGAPGGLTPEATRKRARSEKVNSLAQLSSKRQRTDDSCAPQTVQHPEKFPSTAKRVPEQPQQDPQLDTDPEPAGSRSNGNGDPSRRNEAQTLGEHSKLCCNEADKSHNQAEVQNASTGSHRDNRAPCVFFRLKDDPEKWPLTKTYSDSNNVIIINETAIADARSYMNALQDTDEVQTEENRKQIMELVTVVEQEKARRDSALAAVIVYNWAGTQEKLVSLLNEELSEENTLGAKHEKWVAINSQISAKNRQLAMLEEQLQVQLHLESTLPPSITGAGKSLRYKKLRGLSAKWTQEQAAKVDLVTDRQELLLCFLQGDDKIRKVVRELLAKIRRT